MLHTCLSHSRKRMNVLKLVTIPNELKKRQLKNLDAILVFFIFAQILSIMTVISIRDFRTNQGKYLGLAANGESVILTSRVGSFKIVPVSEDDSLISKKEFFARVDEARRDIAAGKGLEVNTREALASLLESSG